MNDSNEPGLSGEARSTPQATGVRRQATESEAPGDRHQATESEAPGDRRQATVHGPLTSVARRLSPDTYADRACARVELDHARQEGQVEVARGALRMIVETTEYVSDRSTHLSSNVAEGMKVAETLGAVSRQIRTLSGNTSLEASRLGGNATVAEIARQMRLLSQQVSALSEHLLTCLRSQGVALGELSGAIDAVLADASSTQALLERGLTTDYESAMAPLLGLLQSVPESAAAMERAADG